MEIEKNDLEEEIKKFKQEGAELLKRCGVKSVQVDGIPATWIDGKSTSFSTTQLKLELLKHLDPDVIVEVMEACTKRKPYISLSVRPAGDGKGKGKGTGEPE